MQLRRIAGTCPDGYSCPTAYVTDRGTLVIQGYTVDTTTLAVPDGEAAVEVPLTLVPLIEEAMRAHRPQ